MAPTLPTSADVRKARTQANKAVSERFDLVRTPLLAVLGAGDLGVNKVNDALSKARKNAEERRGVVTERVEKLQSQLSDLPTELRERFEAERARYNADELRKRYDELAERGEGALDRIRKQPRVAKTLDSISDVNERFEKQVDKVVDDVHDRFTTADAKVTAVRADAADKVEEAGSTAAAKVEEAGATAAETTKTTATKAATKAAPRRGNGAAAKRTTNGGTAK
ncbi:iron-regulated heparin-binding hemagglutinin HbhA [Pseudonocardia eucalypti]|uniref:Iron-regulated heparin-binding hemagglutinin HbhA n=1 Tax=Pseudonocardia eucalypti TaxID=648755 RepID=A0ABP9Q0I6_9PSEU|nr:heparin binding hemagglutinin HbhA [Pseudonocardia eucalypti]